MKVKVIFNPCAKRCSARGRAGAVQGALRAAGLDYELIETVAVGDAGRAAQFVARGDFDAIVAAGGDGTVSETVNGLIAASGEGPSRPLGILPLGTANDFAEMAGLPRDLRQAAAVIAGGCTRRVDAGCVTYRQPESDRRAARTATPGFGAAGVTSRYFNNNCALAMEPVVTIENTRVCWPSGNLRYTLALFRALRKLKAWRMRITWDDGGYEGPVHLFSVCNSPRCGGVFRMAPDARLDDGLFDFVFAPELPKLDVLRLLPRLFRGTHVRHPQVLYARAQRITIESDPGTPIHADGEVLAESATRVEYEILPGKLTLLTPARLET
ncbi:MAG: diacylglycerol/lipid kinase family protein [Phycisphaerae bacterium]